MGYRTYTNAPSLTTVITDHIQSHLDELHTAMPARVERYDPARQEVDVKPLIKDAWPDEEATMGIRPVEYPVIPGVPVLFPGAGAFRITWPINRGDGVLLVFSEVALDIWKNSLANTIVDPQAYWRHHIADAMALPGLNPFTRPWTGASTTEMTIGVDGGLQIHIGPGGIDLGGGSTDFVAMAGKVMAALQDIATKFNAHTHVAAGTPTGTPALSTPPIVLTAPASVGSATVKVKP